MNTRQDWTCELGVIRKEMADSAYNKMYQQAKSRRPNSIKRAVDLEKLKQAKTKGLANFVNEKEKK